MTNAILTAKCRYCHLCRDICFQERDISRHCIFQNMKILDMCLCDQIIQKAVKDYKHIHTETNTQHHTDDIVAQYDRNAHHDDKQCKM